MTPFTLTLCRRHVVDIGFNLKEQVSRPSLVVAHRHSFSLDLSTGELYTNDPSDHSPSPPTEGNF